MKRLLPKVILENPISPEGFARYLELNRTFHREVWSLAKSPSLFRELEHACKIPFTAPEALVFSPADYEQSTAQLAAEQHRAIIEAIENRECARPDGTPAHRGTETDRRTGHGFGPFLHSRTSAFVETEDERFILERHDPLEKREYVRFVIGRKDEDSHVEQGIFQAAAQALEWRTITGSDADELNELRAWFSDNLERPTSFGRDKLRLGICWFKTGATEHISRIWEMVRILERNGIYVRKIRTDKPGYVVYEDEWQLVAEPFRKGTMLKR